MQLGLKALDHGLQLLHGAVQRGDDLIRVQDTAIIVPMHVGLLNGLGEHGLYILRDPTKTMPVFDLVGSIHLILPLVVLERDVLDVGIANI